MQTNTLSPELLHQIDAYWRAANYLSVCQIYLYDNPLLKRPLTLADVKHLLLGTSTKHCRQRVRQIRSWRGRPMLNHKLLLPEGILVLEPATPLEASDFAALAGKIDPYIAEHGSLPGLMLHVKAFPGWLNLEAALAHMRFIESHHRKLRRLAVVSDSHLLTEVPKIIGHLVQPEVKHFPESAYEDALRWLREAPTPAN